MNNKYEFTGETKIILGVKLHQIRAIITFACVASGAVGGWIANESNLSSYGDAWVYGNAHVYGNARVYGNAHVYGNALVYGDAEVFGDAHVYGDAEVFGDAWVYGDALVSPIAITGLLYPVTITDRHMSIGCEMHTFQEWSTFDDRQIAEMDGAAARKFWDAHKEPLLALIRASGRATG